MNNNSFHTLDVLKICTAKLGIDFKRGGPHFNGWFELNGVKTVRITVPKGRKPIPAGTYSAMARQLKLKTGEFDKLLECPLQKKDYIELLAGRS